MAIKRQVLVGAIIALIITSDAAVASAARILHVANNGFDSDTCGTAGAPCRSITQAIANAAEGDTISVGPGLYGDIDGDGQLTSPGDEKPEAWWRFCALEVNKRVTIISRDGASSTAIWYSNLGVSEWMIRISANGARFGKPNRGFTVLPLSKRGIWIEGENVTLEGNVVEGADFAYTVAGARAVVRRNRASSSRWGFQGAVFSQLTHNVAIGNQFGFDIYTTSGLVTHNIAVANGTNFLIQPPSLPADGLIIRNNVAAGSWSHNINVAYPYDDAVGTIRVTNNTIIGAAPPPNCGLADGSKASIEATGNYWGAATGPGAKPADNVCIYVPEGTTNVSSPATREIRKVASQQR